MFNGKYQSPAPEGKEAQHLVGARTGARAVEPPFPSKPTISNFYMRKPKFREVRLLSQDHTYNQEAVKGDRQQEMTMILHATHNLTKDERRPGVINSPF